MRTFVPRSDSATYVMCFDSADPLQKNKIRRRRRGAGSRLPRRVLARTSRRRCNRRRSSASRLPRRAGRRTGRPGRTDNCRVRRKNQYGLTRGGTSPECWPDSGRRPGPAHRRRCSGYRRCRSAPSAVRASVPRAVTRELLGFPMDFRPTRLVAYCPTTRIPGARTMKADRDKRGTR
jgi:hypothetical protein